MKTVFSLLADDNYLYVGFFYGFEIHDQTLTLVQKLDNSK